MKANPENVWCAGSFPMRAPVHHSHQGSLKALARSALQPDKPIDAASPWNTGASGSSGAAGASGSLQDAGAESAGLLRARLQTLAAAEYMDAAIIHRLHDLDVAECIGLDSRQLGAYVSLLAETAERHAGRVPAGHTAAIHCQHCGPVWAHPDIAEVLPMVGGWSRALGCPWCFVRKAGGYIPRPRVTCDGCQHFTPDTINPETGMGACTQGHGSHYPMAPHACGDHSTRNSDDEA